MNESITVSEFNALVNQTLAFAYSEVVVEGEVSSYKVSQGKWVFFDLKDDSSVIGCFIPIFQLKQAVEDGMLLRVRAVPQLTKWGKFSLNVRAVELSGEGSVKRAFELLKQKFQQEGLFEESRKRRITEFPQRIILITSKQAAAYNDFITVLNERFSGIAIDHYQVQVQGEDAVGQITQAISYANSADNQYDALVLIRGGGSIEDLQAFNQEEIVRAIYASNVPTIVGVGHQDDVTLAELASDIRAATPTDAARRLVADRNEVRELIKRLMAEIEGAFSQRITSDRVLVNRFEFLLQNQFSVLRHNLAELCNQLGFKISTLVSASQQQLALQQKLLNGLDPKAILARGYSIARVGGSVIKDATKYDGHSPIMLQLNKGSLSLVSQSKEELKND